MDIERFLTDYKITYMTGGKNWAPGWVQITCPFCGDSGFHGGFNLSNSYYNCWRCGHQPLTITVMKLAKTNSFKDAKALIRAYSEGFVYSGEEKKIAGAKICNLPYGCSMSLPPMHKQYLMDRYYIPSKISAEWYIKSTGPIGDYKFRIIAPILVDGVMVSYQGRDITGKQTLRYKACKTEHEVMHHKHVVYGIDYVKDGKCIIVEGITDVWRLGKGSVAMFGTQWTPEQLLFLKRRGVKEGLVMFDAGATEQGLRLMNELNAFGLNFQQLIMKDGDPGSLSQDEADELMKLVR